MPTRTWATVITTNMIVRARHLNIFPSWCFHNRVTWSELRVGCRLFHHCGMLILSLDLRQRWLRWLHFCRQAIALLWVTWSIVNKGHCKYAYLNFSPIIPVAVCHSSSSYTTCILHFYTSSVGHMAGCGYRPLYLILHLIKFFFLITHNC